MRLYADTAPHGQGTWLAGWLAERAAERAAEERAAVFLGELPRSWEHATTSTFVLVVRGRGGAVRCVETPVDVRPVFRPTRKRVARFLGLDVAP